MPAEAADPGARRARARRLAHTATAWSTLVWMLLLVAGLVVFFLARVTVCSRAESTDRVLGRICDFRGPGVIGIVVGLALILGLLYLLAAYESTFQTIAAPRWKRVIPVGAYSALKRHDTPHRRKSISSLVLFLVLAVFFYLIVAVLPIAFS